MHELSLATEIHRLCRARLRDEGPARLDRVEVCVGELSAVEPDLLRYAWEALTAGSPDDGAILDVAWRPAKQVCDGCEQAAEREPGSWVTRCPRCGEPLRIEGGFELDVVGFTYTSLTVAAEGP